MAITTALTTGGKLACLKGELLAAHTYKVALYAPAAVLDATTVGYTATNECTGTGYTAGGLPLTVTYATSGTTAFVDYADVSWTGLTTTARGCMIYDDTDVVAPKRAIAVIDFGADRAITAGTLTIQWPTPDSTNAIIRLA